MPDGRDDVTDRVSRRFESPDETPDSEKAGNEGDDRNAKNDTNEGNSMNAMKPVNVKEEWNAISFYLPDSLSSPLTKSYKQIDLDLTDELEDVDGVNQIKKTRHFYPLVVQAGLERLESMESEELKERIERIDRGERPERE